jgi:hypothetical protein
VRKYFINLVKINLTQKFLHHYQKKKNRTHTLTHTMMLVVVESRDQISKLDKKLKNVAIARIEKKTNKEIKNV